MSLSLLSIVIGLGYAIPNAYGLMNPTAFTDRLRRFPRSNVWGYALMGLATAWFLANLQAERISDFASYKPFMIIGFGLVGVGCCFYVRDFLAVRGLSVVLLLLAKLTLDTARWADTSWRVLLAAWAYVWIFFGMWWTISPWRCRDAIHWVTDCPKRTRVACLVNAILGAGVALLGLTAFR